MAVPADVAKVRGDGPHAAAAAGDLDHDLRRATDRRLDVPADRGRPVSDTSRQPRRRPRSDDAVAGIEEPLAPLDENTIDFGARAHWRIRSSAARLPGGRLGYVRAGLSSATTRDARSRCLRVPSTMLRTEAPSTSPEGEVSLRSRRMTSFTS